MPLMTQSKYSSEGFSEFWIEDCIDYRIDTRVDVAEEGGGLEGKVAGRRVQVIFYAQGIKDVASEERDPANKETHWK